MTKHHHHQRREPAGSYLPQDETDEALDDYRDYINLQKARRDRRRRTLGSGSTANLGAVRQSSFVSVDDTIPQTTPRRGRRRTPAATSENQPHHPGRPTLPQGRRRNVRRQTLDALQVLGMRQNDDEWHAFLNATSHHNLTSHMSRASSGHLDDLESVYEDSSESEDEESLAGENPAKEKTHDHGHDDHHSHGLLLPFYCPPVQRQLWDDDQVLPHVNWHDLFFDLIFVAAAYNLGVMLISAMNEYDWPRGVVYFIAIFGPLYTIWENDVIYASRYTLVDYSHRLAAVLRFLCVSFAVLSIKPLDLLGDKHSAETLVFCTSLFVESLVQLALNLELYLYGEGDRTAIQNQTKRETFSSILPASLTYLIATIIAGYSYSQDYISSYSSSSSSYGSEYAYNTTSTESDYNSTAYQSNGDYRRGLAEESDYSSDSDYGFQWSIADLPLLLCLGSYVFNLLFALYQKSSQTKKEQDVREHYVPNNIDYMIHRYGEWIMLMIGESILSLLIVETTEAHEYYAIAVLGSLTVIILQILMFESQPSQADGHALWRSMTAASLFSILIQILSVGLVAFGVSYKLMLKTVLKEHDSYDRRLAETAYVTEEANAWLFCGSLAVVLISLELMMGTHRGVAETYNLLFRVTKDLPEGWSFNWPLITISMAKVIIVTITANLGHWITDTFHVAIIGFVIVTAMAMIRIIGWGFMHHEDFINNAVSSLRNDVSRSVHTFMKKASESLFEELDATANTDSTRTDRRPSMQPTMEKHQATSVIAAIVAKGTSFKPTERRQSEAVSEPWLYDNLKHQTALAEKDADARSTSKEESTGSKKRLPEGWSAHKSRHNGKVFYRGPDGKTQWDHPSKANSQTNDNNLPASWKAYVDPETRETYFYNEKTRRTTWTDPSSKSIPSN